MLRIQKKLEKLQKQLLALLREASPTPLLSNPKGTKEANLAVVSSTTSVKEWWLAQFPGIGKICAKP